MLILFCDFMKPLENNIADISYYLAALLITYWTLILF